MTTLNPWLCRALIVSCALPKPEGAAAAKLANPSAVAVRVPKTPAARVSVFVIEILRQGARLAPSKGVRDAGYSQPTASPVGSGRISREDFGVGRGRRGSRKPAPPPPSSHSRTPEPLLTTVPARGLWSETVPSLSPDGVSCGTACTATSPAWLRVWRASTHV